MSEFENDLHKKLLLIIAKVEALETLCIELFLANEYSQAETLRQYEVQIGVCSETLFEEKKIENVPLALILTAHRHLLEVLKQSRSRL